MGQAATSHHDDPFRLPPIPRPPLAIGRSAVTIERSAR
jgi:hypothetical protein